MNTPLSTDESVTLIDRTDGDRQAEWDGDIGDQAEQEELDDLASPPFLDVLAGTDVHEERLHFSRTTSANGEPDPALLGRHRESSMLHRLLDAARSGRSRSLVLRGAPGIGKSALLQHLARSASGCRIARATGVESEMQLPYAGLHQLCASVLDLRERIPTPQREALTTVFGLSAGPPPDPFVVGLATLTLLAVAAEQEPIICIVDDAQWLDPTSEQILSFVARRLEDQRVAIVCAARSGVGDDVLVGLPEMRIGGLSARNARALLLGNVHGAMNPAICDQIVADSDGNPLALLERLQTWSDTEMAGGFVLPSSDGAGGKLERTYSQRLAQLPPESQLLVLAAAAEPSGDAVLFHRAATMLGIPTSAVNAAVDAGLLTVGARVMFAHPLIRSASYREATADDRQRIHRALAEATDADIDPDRRAWHRAHATSGPDEHIAAELERSAVRAQIRGGVAAAAAFLQRAVALTVDPARRAQRALTAAQASLQGGAFREALGSLVTAEAGPLDEFQRAQADLLRAHAAFASDFGSDAPPLLLKAARQLEPFDSNLARETFLAALGAANVAGYLARDELRLEICRAIRSIPSADADVRPLDMLLDGLALLETDGHAAANATLQRAVRALADASVDEVLRWGWIGTDASGLVWDIEGMYEISARHVQLVRRAGGLAQLPIHLWQLGVATAWTGDFAGAASIVAESDSVAAATGSQIAPYAALRLAALRGNEQECSVLVAEAFAHAKSRGQGAAEVHAHWSVAVLYNGLGRYEQAASAAQHAVAGTAGRPPTTPCAMWALPELVEAATRAGDAELAGSAFSRLAETTGPCGTDFALGIEARCRALLGGADAEELYRTAIEALERTRLTTDLARARLVYGEWLRREGRRAAARQELRLALGMFSSLGMEAFDERARRELLATGEKIRRRGDARDQLTPQEEHITRLAGDGLSNPEIAAQLFISSRTVEWHLRNAFTKLNLTSRKDLRRVIPRHRPQTT